MGLLNRLFGRGKQEEPQRPPEETRPLAEVCDEYIALMGPYQRDQQRVWNLRRRMGKLMYKHDIQYIARGKTLVDRDWGWDEPSVALAPLCRLGPHVFAEGTKGAHLMPLVDALLEADGNYERNQAKREALNLPLARSAAKEYGIEEGVFVYGGYRFDWRLRGAMYPWSSPTGYVYVTRVTDLDG